MISQETAELVWSAYREIQAGKKLLKDMADTLKEDIHREERRLKDAFGRRRELELGVPSGENGHRIFSVAPELAESVIRAHIANKEKELVEANECARIEIQTGTPTDNS